MNKLFKTTKKFMLLVTAVVMMLATSMVVLGANGENELKTLKPAKTSVTLYENASEAGMADVTATGKDGAAMVPMDSSITLKVTTVTKKAGAVGDFKVQSSDPSVASVTKDGDTITITAEGVGKATIKLTDADPANPKKAKTAKVTVTVKSLVDTITFDNDVVKTSGDDKYVEVGLKGSVTLGTTTNKASNQKVKYVLLGDAKKYISVSAKGVVKGNKLTSGVEGGYVQVCVVAQDQKYAYPSGSKSKTATWGVNEIINVFVGEPTVQSAKILNAEFAKADTESKYLAGKAAQAYTAIPLETNAASSAHTYKLQVAAYSGTKWDGQELANAVTFTSNKPKVATVDKNGVITAVGNGTATITVVPVDGVSLAGKEKLTINVSVSTAAERIELASTEVTAFAGKAYAIKANVNKGVKNTKLNYTLVSSTVADAKLSGKNVTCKAEGTVVVEISSQADPAVKKQLTINFIDPISKITATVPAYQDIYKDKKNNILFESTPVKQASSTTLYVDRTYTEYVDEQWVTKTVDDTCVITTTVEKKYKTEANLSEVEATSSNPNVVKVLGEVENGFEVQAVGKGSAKVTITAKDGSKVKKVVTIKVVQKVNAINVANAVDGEIYLAPDKNGVTKTTFKATTNADASNKNVTYKFIPNYMLMQNASDVYKALTNKTSSISLTKDANALLFPEGGNEAPVLLGTLRVTAKDGLYFKLYEAPEVTHNALYKEIKVYAVKNAQYVTADLFAEKVANMTAAFTGGAEGITLYKGQAIDLASALKIPAQITDRTVTWSVGVDKDDKTDKNYITVKNGVVTGKKVTVIGDSVTVKVTMNTLENGTVKPISKDVEVRVIPSLADFNSELNAQITTLLKENNYTWLGAKPTFNAKTAAFTLAISDITMSKEAANDEMRAKLTDAMRVVKDAAELATYGTSTKYNTVTIKDVVNNEVKNVWALERVGADVNVLVNGELKGTYSFVDVDAAIADLADLITADIDDIVEWANKNLSVTLTATNTAANYSSKDYTTSYTVSVTIKEADVETYLDAKVNNAVVKFANANDKAVTGIESVTYDAATNTATVDIFDGHKVIADVYTAVKADAVASLEDIFVKAVSATVEVDGEFETRTLEYVRGTESDVNKLVDELYTEITAKYTEMTGLEGVKAVATVNFDFSGTVYTKQYNLVFKRTAAAIDADVDNNIDAFLAGLEANPYATLEYVASENLAVVTVNDFDATLGNALSVVNDVEAFVNTLTGDVFAYSATVDGTTEFGPADLGKITATQVLNAIKPEWKEDGEVLSRELTELLGKTATVKVVYSNGQELYYTVKFVANYDKIATNIATVVDAQVAAINAKEFSEELYVLKAYKEGANSVIVVLNDEEEKVAAKIDELAGTGLFTMLETVLTEAKENCGQTATVTVGKKSVTPPLADIDKAMVASMVEDLGIKTVADLTKNPFEIVIGLADGREITYVVDFVAESLNGKHEWYPEYLTMGVYEYTKAVRAGEVVYYTGNIGGMILTVTGENAYVIYNGVTYPAVDGVATVAIENGMFPSFAIGNSGANTVEYNFAFTYPVGHMENPEVISDLSTWGNYYDGSLEANDYMGYNYTYTAIADGTFTLALNISTSDVKGDIVVSDVTDEDETVQYLLSEDAVVNEYGETVLAITVEEGDTFDINVAAVMDEKTFVIPAMDYTLVASFTYPLGSEQNPIFLDLYEIPGYVWELVPAKETIYVQSYAIGGTKMTLSDGTGNAVVTYNGKDYKTNKTTKTIEVEFEQPMGRQPVIFSIKNPNSKPAGYSMYFEYPAGHMMNPEVIEEMGTLEAKIKAGSQGYYFTWKATKAGTLTVDISGTKGGWMYNVNNMTTWVYGESHWSDETTPVSKETITVNANEEIQIMVNTYDPENPWSAPAGTVKLAVSFEEKPVDRDAADAAIDTALTAKVATATDALVVSATYDAFSNGMKVVIDATKANEAIAIVKDTAVCDLIQTVLLESQKQGAQKAKLISARAGMRQDVAFDISDDAILELFDCFNTISELVQSGLSIQCQYDNAENSNLVLIHTISFEYSQATPAVVEAAEVVEATEDVIVVE